MPIGPTSSFGSAYTNRAANAVSDTGGKQVSSQDVLSPVLSSCSQVKPPAQQKKRAKPEGYNMISYEA